MRITICTILIYNLCWICSANASKKIWSWTLDTVHYSLHIEEQQILFMSDMSVSRVKKNNCSQKFIKNFIQTFQDKMQNYKEKGQLPKGYSAIEMQSPDLGRFDIARGIELGLFLIDMKLQIAQLKSRTESLCKL